MVVTNILREQSLQMAFLHRDNVPQQVSSAAFDPALRHTVLPGTLVGRADRAYLQGSNGRGNLQPVFRTPVENPNPGLRSEGHPSALQSPDPLVCRLLL